MEKPDLQTMLNLASKAYTEALQEGIISTVEVGDRVNKSLEDYIKGGDFPPTTAYKFSIQGDGEGNVIKNGVVKAHFLGGGLNIEIVEEHITFRNTQPSLTN
jgi:hypothetical protein